MHTHPPHTLTCTQYSHSPYTQYSYRKLIQLLVQKKAVAIIGNIIGLYSVLTLCFFIWFTRLYVSWACIESSNDFLLLCQLTNQIQCYSCNNSEAYQCIDEGLAECVKHPSTEPFHCLSPTYTLDIDNKRVRTTAIFQCVN